MKQLLEAAGEGQECREKGARGGNDGAGEEDRLTPEAVEEVADRQGRGEGAVAVEDQGEGGGREGDVEGLRVDGQDRQDDAEAEGEHDPRQVEREDEVLVERPGAAHPSLVGHPHP